MDLPYRANVGAVLFNGEGGVFVGRRKDAGAWQLPQGGIDDGEDPRLAVMRELQEEVGTANAAIIGEHPRLLTYDLPAELIGKVWGGRYRGQQQRWYALRFLGRDDEIRLDADDHPEFDAWRWAALGDLPGLAVAFKRPIYEELVRAFGPYSRPAD